MLYIYEFIFVVCVSNTKFEVLNFAIAMFLTIGLLYLFLGGGDSQTKASKEEKKAQSRGI